VGYVFYALLKSNENLTIGYLLAGGYGNWFG